MVVTMSPKKWAALIGIGLALVVGGYAGGRFAAPDKVVTTEKIVTVHDTQVVKVVDQDAILKAIQNVSVQKDVHKTKTTVKQKDGTVTTTETTDDKSKTDAQTKTDTESKTKTAENTHTVDVQERVVTKLVERSRPSWRLSLQPGLDVPYLLGHTQGSQYSLLPSQDLLKYVVMGVSIEHRFIGPLSAGVWANTRGAGGLVLSLEF